MLSDCFIRQRSPDPEWNRALRSRSPSLTPLRILSTKMVSIGTVSSEDSLGRPRSGVSAAHSLSPAISPARHRDTHTFPFSRRPSVSSSSSKGQTRRLAGLSIINSHGNQLKKDARPQSSSAPAKDAMENPRRSFFRRKSRTFRRQTSELNLADAFTTGEYERSPSLSRRHRSRHSEFRMLLPSVV